MLILCNGAYKSGSTWLFRIVQSITGFGFIPEKYHEPGWNGLGIRPRLLGKFLRDEDYATHDYILKGHFLFHHHLILSRTNVAVMCIERDLRDVIVSAYYYEKMKGNHSHETFDAYYFDRGWRIAQQVTRYNKIWRRSPKTHMSSYERLHGDFTNEVRGIAGFLKKTLSDADVERVRQENTLESLKEKFDEKSADGKMSFYRKGIVGDWQSHMTPKILEDLKRIETEEADYPSAIDLLKLRVKYELAVRWRK